MNFLALCREAHARAGYSGDGPASVDNQTGQSARIVSYVNDAWIEIQRARTNWAFMLRKFDAVILAGQTFAPIPDADKAGGDLIRSVEKDSWFSSGSGISPYRLRWLDADYRGALENSITTGRPEYFWHSRTGITVAPNVSSDHRITGYYYLTPQSFASTTTGQNKTRPIGERTPEMPQEYHMAIVWLAVRNIGGFEESANTYQLANTNYQKIFGDMCQTELPSIRFGRPLA